MKNTDYKPHTIEKLQQEMLAAVIRISAEILTGVVQNLMPAADGHGH
jgi:hypothetical protein